MSKFPLRKRCGRNFYNPRMRRASFTALAVLCCALIPTIFLFGQTNEITADGFITYTVNPKKQNIKFYWKDDNGQIFKSINNLKQWIERKNVRLLFAMNGGMYNTDNAPHGLFIDNGKLVVPLDTTNGNGNFYLQPNGVFYITKENKPFICTTNKFNNSLQAKYATQSGPMLLIDGQIHPAFMEGSLNLNVRNGVGILPDGNIIFAMSKKKINFYDFAVFFKNKACKNALYLDGLVSRTYLPEQKQLQTDGNFGVMIGVTSLR